MLVVNNVRLQFGQRILFQDVNLKFSAGFCYGLIGANGAGKSTFLKILSGEIEPTNGTVGIDPEERMAVLRQDHFAFDEYTILDTVYMGHKKLYEMMQEREAIYSKEDFTDENGLRAGELEAELAELDGYEAEAQASTLLNRLGIPEGSFNKKMKELEDIYKVRVLLAQALFGNPDILLLDEPTNHLDLKSISWLEDFLSSCDKTVIVVSHDRHFLDQVCTHIADIDYGSIRLYAGNYSFWYAASRLARRQRKDASKKREDKIKELQAFVQRFSANAARSRQATARKKLIDKLTPEDMPATTRKFPYIVFKPQRECGNIILTVENLSRTVDGKQVLKDFSMTVAKNEKIAFVGDNIQARTALFQILAGEMEPDAGTVSWGQTITRGYFPRDNSGCFSGDYSLIDWLKQYSDSTEESYVRGFLGRMLFSGEEVFKKTSVLSGGERVRCMLSRLMLSGPNVMILDEPTNHLDLESIATLNEGLEKYPEVLLFSSHDHEFVDSIANRIIEFTPGGVIDKLMRFDDYLASEEVQKMRDELYQEHHELSLQ